MLQDFISLFFPRVCLSCQGSLAKQEEQLCTGCRLALPTTQNHRQTVEEFEQKFTGLIPYDQVLVYLYFQKKGIAQKLLHSLKYDDNPEIGEMLGRWYGRNLKEVGFDKSFDLIVPIPLHTKKFRQRGYNQSEVFANGLSEAMCLPLNPSLLVRYKATTTQTRKGRVERWENVSGIFGVEKPECVQGKRILLVDDVLTTGATLMAAAAPLLESKAASVSFAVIASAK